MADSHPRPRRVHRRRTSSIDIVPPSPSNTNSTLPDYSREFIAAYDQPPDYPDSADEADHESDDRNSAQFAPPLSPRHSRRKLFRNTSTSSQTSHSHSRSRSTAKLPYISPAPPAAASDTYLDALLERSVHALELSNTLLRSSMSTQSSLSSIVNSNEFDDADRTLDARARLLSSRIRSNRNTHDRWLDDLDDLAEDVEELCQNDGDDGGRLRTRVMEHHHDSSSMLSQSLPSSSMPRRRHRRPHSLDINSAEAVHGQLHSQAQLRHIASPPPRAMTQYVSVASEYGDASETTSNASSIYLPSTMGLRAGPQVQTFGSPRSSASTIIPHLPSSSSLRRANSSPTSARNWRNSRSASTQVHESRSRSRSSNGLPSPAIIPRLLPPPIEELPSQSDSSAESPQDKQAYRTMECLRKILDDMPPPSDEKLVLSTKASPRSPGFAPRTPPVVPSTSTSTTTTSISRLFSKSRHSTSTRAPSPPRQSSLKHRPPPLSTSMLSIPDITASQSTTSSGRSTPRNVAFGPLPESYAGSKGGSPSRFKERKEAKARAKSDKAKRGSKSGKGKNAVGDGDKDRESEGSWWTVWLTGGSGLSMNATRSEERSEDRMARAWARPGFGGALEEWPV